MTTRDRTQEPEQQFAILLAMKDGNYACLIAVLLFIANGMWCTESPSLEVGVEFVRAPDSQVSVSSTRL